MTEENVKASITVNAPEAAVFDVLADASTHEAIDGTGWVREPLNEPHLTQVGQIFRIKMFHDNHPQKFYEMSNRVEVLDRPRAIAWKPGQGPDDAGNVSGGDKLDFGGWIWRYDLEPAGAGTTRVTLSYDWSQVPAESREYIGFPPFEMSHLDNSLKHLAALAEARA
jgi:hypothetical protein